MVSREATNTNFIIFGLTRSGFEPMIHRSWGENANHYTTHAIHINKQWRRGNKELTLVTDKHYHIMLYQVHLAWTGFELTTLVVVDTDSTGSCKSNYHTITATTAPRRFELEIYITGVGMLAIATTPKMEMHLYSARMIIVICKLMPEQI